MNKIFKAGEQVVWRAIEAELAEAQVVVGEKIEGGYVADFICAQIVR